MTVNPAHTASSADHPAPRDLDWNIVYRDQLPRIYNYFRFRIGRDADVEDLTARTFEKAWKARDQYRQDLAGPPGSSESRATSGTTTCVRHARI
jgi:DNA-directed RNA polymerase specialized sigma24 family protein